MFDDLPGWEQHDVVSKDPCHECVAYVKVDDCEDQGGQDQQESFSALRTPSRFKCFILKFKGQGHFVNVKDHFKNRTRGNELVSFFKWNSSRIFMIFAARM